METQERQYLLDHLVASETRMLQLTEGLTPGQWHFKESPERWSIAENVEHCILIEKTVLGSVQRAIAGPKDAEKRAAAEARAASKEAPIDTSRKLESPKPFLPQGRFPDSAALLAGLRTVRAETSAFALATQADLHDYFFPHMAFGDMDCFQWLMLTSHHIDRHARQIERLMKDPAYPA